MSTPIVIGAACSHCILDVLALGRSNIIVLVDYPREPAMKTEDTAKVILEFHRVREYPTGATFPPMPSKREERQAQQPFYRNLKKYRKP